MREEEREYVHKRERERRVSLPTLSKRQPPASCLPRKQAGRRERGEKGSGGMVTGASQKVLLLEVGVYREMPGWEERGHCLPSQQVCLRDRDLRDCHQARLACLPVTVMHINCLPAFSFTTHLAVTSFSPDHAKVSHTLGFSCLPPLPGFPFTFSFLS